MRSLVHYASRLSTGVALAALAGGLCLPPAAAQAQPVPGTTASPATVIDVPQHPGPPGVRTAEHPLQVKVLGHGKNGRPLIVQGAPGGYTAAQLRTVVGLKGTGIGQTVAIVDAFDDPYAVQDLNTYSTQMGLPGVCKAKRTRQCFTFTSLAPFGTSGFDSGWALETSLDIEMVHAMAPQAAITLVEANDNTLDSLFQAVNYAALVLHAPVISNSWGSSEFSAETASDYICQLTHGVCVFSSGDSGYPGAYPAYNPSVLAVGGTTLQLDRTGHALSEVGWGFPTLDGVGSGGGVSQYEPRPAYQDQVNPDQGRGIPDVSFDADPRTGVAVYSTADAGWLQVGGTSVGAPAWSGILAAADQLRTTAGMPVLTAADDEVHSAIYHLASGLADITSGSNGTCGTLCTAGPGYDFVTGMGSPRPSIDTALTAAP